MTSVESFKGWVEGRVQGVAFRASLKAEADRRRLRGWVRNLADGRVEFLIQGDSIDVEAMMAWARCGPRLARVDEAHFEPDDRADAPTTLDIRF